MSVTYRFGTVEVEVWDDRQHLVTRFPDGTTVPASPEDTDAYRATALDLGYGQDTWRMCRDHELLHTWRAHLIDGSPSLALWLVAHGYAGPAHPLVADEEHAVLDMQRHRVIPDWSKWQVTA